MIFNSLTFLFFFAAVHCVYALPLSWEKRKVHLWLSSYIFYAAWNPPFVVLLWISTLVDWFAGQKIAKAATAQRKKIFLALSLAVNLGMLGYFKYGGFLLETFASFLQAAGLEYQPAAPNIILPVGISFYTFQSLSYTLDIYRGRLEPWPRFTDFAFYVTFFPQLVAGPIVRAADFLPQCLEPKRATPYQMGWGLSLLVIGLFEKVILADTVMAPIADTVFANPEGAGSMDAWSGAFGFTSQVFFDFSGYSLCAIGVAMTFGFVLPDNFRFPFAAIGFSDFWQRWHISLSSWLRDYLYISLGGNRRGDLRTFANLMMTMLLGGLWHGAAWTYVAWGGLQGLYLVVERYLVSILGDIAFFKTKVVRAFLGLLTFVLFCIGLVFFRAREFGDAFTLLWAMFIHHEQQLLSQAETLQVMLPLGVLLVGQALMRDSSLEKVAARIPVPLRILLIIGALLALSLHSGGERAFIYFQF